MDNQWKCEKCGTCNFVVEWMKDIGFGNCKYNPPTIPETKNNSQSVISYSYPTVAMDNPACSKWREQ